ncbi:hypothetical protein V8C40DRAFT_245470 [Trichoderma camerunense]
MLSPLCQGIPKTRMWTPDSEECATNESDFVGVPILGLNFWKPGVLDFYVVVFVSLPLVRPLFPSVCSLFFRDFSFHRLFLCFFLTGIHGALGHAESFNAASRLACALQKAHSGGVYDKGYNRCGTMAGPLIFFHCFFFSCLFYLQFLITRPREVDGVGGRHSVCHSVILAFPIPLLPYTYKGDTGRTDRNTIVSFFFTMLCPLFNPHSQQAGVEGLVFTSVT